MISLEEAITFTQEVYKRQGFIVLACRFEHVIGERISPEDDVFDGQAWKVIGAATQSEFLDQYRGPSARIPAGHFHFYKIEAMD